MNFNIREGLKADLPQVLELIKELAIMKMLLKKYR